MKKVASIGGRPSQTKRASVAKAPKLSKSAKASIRKGIDARAETATHAHSIRMG